MQYFDWYGGTQRTNEPLLRRTIIWNAVYTESWRYLAVIARNDGMKQMLPQKSLTTTVAVTKRFSLAWITPLAVHNALIMLLEAVSDAFDLFFRNRGPNSNDLLVLDS